MNTSSAKGAGCFLGQDNNFSSAKAIRLYSGKRHAALHANDSVGLRQSHVQTNVGVNKAGTMVEFCHAMKCFVPGI